MFNGPFPGTTQVSRHQKGKTNLDFTEARDSEWQWHQLGHMQVCTSLQTDNHASTPPPHEILITLYYIGTFCMLITIYNCPAAYCRDEAKQTERNDLLFVEKMMWMDERDQR